MGESKKRLGEVLMDTGRISKDQLDYALELQKMRGHKLGKIFVDEGMITEAELVQILGLHSGIPHVILDKHYIEPSVAKAIPEPIARKHVALPVRKDRGIIAVAMADPLNVLAVDEIRLAAGMDIQPVFACESDIRSALDFFFGGDAALEAIEDLKREYRNEQGNPSAVDRELSEHINSAPVVRFVNSIIEQAVISRASDIHIEPGDKELRVRFRIDGRLQEIMKTSVYTHQAVVTRIKVISNLNIAERRLPQDGRVEMHTTGKNLDLRVSALPTVYGEKLAIRLLDRDDFLIDKNRLGLTDDNIKRYERLLKIPYGMVLVTGPTGSGKTTTLYTMLNELNNTSINIITLEDPVEYKLEGINQVQINTKAGLSFASGLRSILRQDPDIIMVGEIRDEETAFLAVRAAITGHTVFSTMHTNDAAGAIVRLMDMGVEPYLVASSVSGVISQRLVRKLCPECKSGYRADAEELRLLGLKPGRDIILCRANGCGSCKGTGYLGRTAVFEIMTITEEHRRLINRKAASDKLTKLSVGLGMEKLGVNCSRLVLQGITSIEEMIKAVYVQE
jgi:type IV pilus assembly protein PilB